MFQAEIKVMPLKELLDPQGKAVETSLHKLGFEYASHVRIGKVITLKIDTKNRQDAMNIAEETCKKILYNPVMEYYEIEVIGDHK